MVLFSSGNDLRRFASAKNRSDELSDTLLLALFAASSVLLVRCPVRYQ